MPRLATLRIRHLAVIEDLEVELGEGLNVLTGETGAGKSILLGALSLVAGERADASQVRAGSERAVIEAEIDLSDRDDVRALLEEHGVDDAEGRLVVRREVATSGGGRVFLNGSPSTVAVLRALADELIDLHAQDDRGELRSPDRHQELLDELAGAGDERAAVAAAHRDVAAAEARLEELAQAGKEREARREELSRKVREIDAARVTPGESEALERERRILKNAGQVSELLDEAVGLLHEGERTATSLAARAAKRALDLAAIDPALAAVATRIESARIELDDAGAELRDYRDRATFDPGRLEAVEERTALLERLRLRYGATEDDVLAFREEAASELRTLENLEQETARGEAALREAEDRYRAAAGALTARRAAGAGRLSEAVEGQLAALALPRARFTVRLSPAKGRMIEGRGGPVPLHPRGAERVELFLAANPGEESRPLRSAASGGELSRVMLAVHAVVEGGGEPRILVFDEVDQGVGGSVADAVGQRLRKLGARHQVLCVTHLPQVAAHAARQYQVQKRVSGGRTRVDVAVLTEPERVEELARMLGGREVTDASRRNAEELLAAATGARARTRRRA
jgi:DNA repair protein RecN (Recombination protein N)